MSGSCRAQCVWPPVGSVDKVDAPRHQGACQADAEEAPHCRECPLYLIVVPLCMGQGVQ